MAKKSKIIARNMPIVHICKKNHFSESKLFDVVIVYESTSSNNGYGVEDDEVEGDDNDEDGIQQ